MDSLALETGKYKYLTPAQVTFFMVHGFVRLTDCFSPEKAAEWTSNIWARLGMDPNDKSTWTLPRIHMPSHRNEPVSTFAPKAWGAICELLGGEERIATEAAVWKDSFIVNLGSEEWEGKDVSPKDLDNWHCDGDFFMHYLDSREQALLVIPCFSNIVPGGGGTVISPDGIEVIAKHLYEHPDGVFPSMAPRGQAGQPGYRDKEFYNSIVPNLEEFHEITGNVGDVVLMHPLMLHTASRNSLRIPRIITNPPVTLRTEFNFDRENPEEYSLVELKTLQVLGKDRLKGWKAIGAREFLVPQRVKDQERMKKLELERLKLQNGGEETSKKSSLGGA